MNTRRLPPSVRKKVLPMLLDKHGNKCAACGSIDNLQVDHKRAISEGGSHDIENLQILCGFCNRKKGGAKSPGAPKKENIKKTRKDVYLDQSAIDRLQKLADRKKWSLKKYMEYVLVKDSDKLITVKK